MSDIESGELAEALVVNAEDKTTLRDVYDGIKGDATAFNMLGELESIKERLSALEGKSNE